MEVINALGRRKTAVARVYLTKGKGVITVNNKAAKDVFPTDVLQSKLVQPFALTDTVGKYNVNVNVSGGGINGQVEAIRLGISRALVEVLEENKPALKEETDTVPKIIRSEIPCTLPCSSGFVILTIKLEPPIYRKFHPIPRRKSAKRYWFGLLAKKATITTNK